ncbi:MAG: phage holin family protein [Kofleriaceae bacterium]
MASTRTGPSHARIAAASTSSLFAGLISDARDLAIGHLDRMRSEIGDEFANLKGFLARLAIAIGVLVVSAALLGIALASGLIALGLPAWVAYAIVGVIAGIVGYVLVKRPGANKQDVDLIPESAIAGLRRDLADVHEAARRP